MYVICGLGNPGKKYANTRHNMGFIAIDRLAEKHDIKVDKVKFKSLVGEGRIAGQKVLLMKPQTYMNLSGEAVQEVMRFYKLEPEALIVIYDDLDLEAGVFRLRKFGSAGTHNGMRSVVQHLHTDRFPRIRLGIGSNGKRDIIDHVIGGFTKEEAPILEDAVTTAVVAVECMLREDIDRAMSRYNAKKKSKNADKKNEEVKGNEKKGND